MIECCLDFRECTWKEGRCIIIHGKQILHKQEGGFSQAHSFLWLRLVAGTAEVSWVPPGLTVCWQQELLLCVTVASMFKIPYITTVQSHPCTTCSYFVLYLILSAPESRAFEVFQWRPNLPFTSCLSWCNKGIWFKTAHLRWAHNSQTEESPHPWLN